MKSSKWVSPSCHRLARNIHPVLTGATSRSQRMSPECFHVARRLLTTQKLADESETGVPPSAKVKKVTADGKEIECIQIHGFRSLAVISEHGIDPSTLDLGYLEKSTVSGNADELHERQRLSLFDADSDTETEPESDNENDSIDSQHSTASALMSKAGNHFTQSRTALAALAITNPYAAADSSLSTVPSSRLKAADRQKSTPIMAYEVWHSPPEVYDWVYGFEADCEPPDRHNLKWHWLYKAWGYYSRKERRHRACVYAYMKAQRRCGHPLFWGSVFDLENTFRVELQLLMLHMWFVKVRMVKVSAPLGGAPLSKRAFKLMVEQLGNRFSNHIHGAKSKWQNDCQQATLHLAVALDHAMEDYKEDAHSYAKVVWNELYLSNRDMEHDVLYIWTDYILREMQALDKLSDYDFLNGWWRFGAVPTAEDRDRVRQQLAEAAAAEAKEAVLTSAEEIQFDDDSGAVDDSLGYIHKIQLKREREMRRKQEEADLKKRSGVEDDSEDGSDKNRSGQ